MADITVTAAQVAATFAEEARRRNYVAAEAITAGQAVYLVAATGKVGLADANAAGKHQFLGIAMETAGIGGTLTVLERGEMVGFDLAALNYDDPVYLSDTAGALGTAAGTASVVVGKVRPLIQVHGYVKQLDVFSAPNIVQA